MPSDNGPILVFSTDDLREIAKETIRAGRGNHKATVHFQGDLNALVEEVQQRWKGPVTARYSGPSEVRLQGEPGPEHPPSYLFKITVRKVEKPQEETKPQIKHPPTAERILAAFLRKHKSFRPEDLEAHLADYLMHFHGASFESDSYSTRLSIEDDPADEMLSFEIEIPFIPTKAGRLKFSKRSLNRLEKSRMGRLGMVFWEVNESRFGFA